MVLEGQIVFVTGATGFIGRNLVERLAKIPGLTIRALARSAVGSAETWPSRIQWVPGNLLDPTTFSAALQDVRVVFHLGGLTRARNLQEFQRSNADAVGLLATAARAASVPPRFVLVSSLAAAGPAPTAEGIDERAVCRPVTYYGLSKLAGEMALVQAAQNSLPWTIVRPPAVYGPREKDMLTVFRGVAAGLAPILGFGEKLYSFVYVDDLVEALIRVSEAPSTVGKTYFVASPERVTNLEFVAAIEAATGRRALKPRIPHTFAWGLGALGSILAQVLKRPPLLTWNRLHELTAPRWVCRVDQLARDVGYTCPTGLREGTQRTVEWYREAGWIRS